MAAKKTTAPAPVKVPNVEHVLPEVSKMVPRWRKVRDCIAGQDTIKERGVEFLPMPNAADRSPENIAKYDAYKLRALFTNFVGRTVAGMVGTVFSKPPTADLPELLAVLHENVDGGAVTMDQQAKKVLTDALSVGRVGLLTDYPQPITQEDGTVLSFTRADVQAGIARPTIQFYFAEDILNWRYTQIAGRRMLTLCVLRESFVISDDGFEVETAPQWRVLRLENGVYTCEVFQKLAAGITSVGKYSPTQANGKTFDYVPFEFVGPDNNDGGIDEPPIMDLVEINLAHYRNSADFEEMCFILGQPTPVIAGLTEDWVKEIMKGEVRLGSTTSLLLPTGASATYLEVSESQLSLKAMEHKERQAVAIGARLVSQQTVQRTAKEAGMEDAATQSVLLSTANNVNSAYKRSIQTAALFAGATLTEEQGYRLNTDFEILTLDATAIAARVKAWVDGIITFTECRSVLKRAGWATLDDEKAREELDKDATRNAEALGMVDPKEPANTLPKDTGNEE